MRFITGRKYKTQTKNSDFLCTFEWFGFNLQPWITGSWLAEMMTSDGRVTCESLSLERFHHLSFFTEAIHDYIYSPYFQFLASRFFEIYIYIDLSHITNCNLPYLMGMYKTIRLWIKTVITDHAMGLHFSYINKILQPHWSTGHVGYINI